MERRITPADSAAHPARLVPPEVARWLLGSGNPEDQSVEETIVAAEAAYAHLRARLVVLLGALGFDALWGRAMHLAVRDARSGDGARAVAALALDPPGLREAVGDRDSAEAHALLMAILMSFFTLLVTFIGETLTLRIIHQLWPAFSTGAADGTPD